MMRWSRPRYRAGVDLAVIAAVSMAVYAVSLRGYFLSDDFHVVTLLNAGRSAVNWPNVLSDFYTVYRGDPTHSYYRPMITLSGAIDYTLWGPNPFGGHLTNLLLNVVNGMLVYGIAARLSPSPTRGFGLLAGLLFALHPLHPEAVHWLVGRTELIVACFALLSILLYLTFVERGRPVWWLLSILTFLLALGSKETAVVVPFALTLYQLFFPASGPDRRRYGGVVRLVPYYLLLVVYFAVRKAITGHVVGQYGPMGTELFAPTLMPKGIAHLLAFQLRPTGGALLTPEGDAVLGQTIRGLIDPLAWILVLAIIALVIAARPDRRAWFCLTLMAMFAFPLLSLFAEKQLPIEAARLHYVPSAGFCLFLAALLVTARAPVGRSLGAIIFFSFAVLMAVNGFPWIHAARITRGIVHTIERAANTPGVQMVLVIGNPDFFYGAELFGAKSWALQVAAAPPFARIPGTVRITHVPGEACDGSLAGALQDGRATIALRWEREHWRVNEVTGDRLQEICRGPSSFLPRPDGQRPEVLRIDQPRVVAARPDHVPRGGRELEVRRAQEGGHRWKKEPIVADLDHDPTGRNVLSHAEPWGSREATEIDQPWRRRGRPQAGQPVADEARGPVEERPRQPIVGAHETRL
ncbi:MAG: glycosyltransferase family 39 protein [Candidatus Methylomirabilis oxyfera]|nr:glycosyltransferase family 39 protein [Candidatus Methylomirabilis oxyfera]